MKNLTFYKEILPEFPRIPHLPWKPNMADDDIVSSDAKIFDDNVCVQEKIDGSSCGMSIYEGNPVIRNKNHILNKGFHKDTPAKMQFASVWNYWYKNQDKFKQLERLYGPVSVFGDWMIQAHGVMYDNLPDWFITYDLYDYEQKKFHESNLALDALNRCGFTTTTVLYNGKIKDYAQLEELSKGKTKFATNALREGIVVKLNNEKWQTGCYKMVREGFIQGSLLGETMQKNQLKKN